jgi:hypothetical protein
MWPKHSNNEAFAQNGWFVGFTPRRNPDIVVVVLFEGGEHGKLAARLATQVIKAFVDKQRKRGITQTDVAQANAPTGSAVPAANAPENKSPDDKPAEGGALWTDPHQDHLEGGKLSIPVDRAARPEAKSAPGIPVENKVAPKSAQPKSTDKGSDKLKRKSAPADVAEAPTTQEP